MRHKIDTTSKVKRDILSDLNTTKKLGKRSPDNEKRKIKLRQDRKKKKWFYESRIKKRKKS